MPKPDGIVNGHPLGPQVRVLLERFGGINRGDVVTHEAFASAIGLNLSKIRDYGRYQRVVQAFIRQLERDKGIRLENEKGVGYRAPKTAVEQLNNGVRAGTHKAKQGLKIARTTAECVRGNELPEHVRAQRDHIILRISGLEAYTRTAAKEIYIRLDPPRPMPRLTRA